MREEIKQEIESLDPNKFIQITKEYKKDPEATINWIHSLILGGNIGTAIINLELDLSRQAAMESEFSCYD